MTNALDGTVERGIGWNRPKEEVFVVGNVEVSRVLLDSRIAKGRLCDS